MDRLLHHAYIRPIAVDMAYIIVAKYADGLPLYCLENILARSGHPASRTCMAHWVIWLAKYLLRCRPGCMTCKTAIITCKMKPAFRL
jgi:transposase